MLCYFFLLSSFLLEGGFLILLVYFFSINIFSRGFLSKKKKKKVISFLNGRISKKEAPKSSRVKFISRLHENVNERYIPKYFLEEEFQYP